MNLDPLEKYLAEHQLFAQRLMQVQEKNDGLLITLKSEDLSFQDKLSLEQDLKQAFPDLPVKIHYENLKASKAKEALPHTQKAPHENTPQKLPQVGHIIAVTSAKGGVGKSTVASHLAVTLSEKGYAVGLLDADVYGPSVPTIFEIFEEPKVTSDQKLVPHERYGIKIMSFGFFVPSQSAIMWRGPLVHKALQQLFFSVDWGYLDCLIVDMPPGTGDAHLNLLQNLQLSGTLMVTTPHNLALSDLIRGLNMYQRLGIKILGAVENMSYYISPKSQEKSYPFESKELKAFFAQQDFKKFEIPLHQDFARSSSGLSYFHSIDPHLVGNYHSITNHLQKQLKLEDKKDFFI